MQEKTLRSQLSCNIKRLVDYRGKPKDVIENEVQKFAQEYRNEVRWYVNECDGLNAQIVGYVDEKPFLVKTVDDLIDYILRGEK